MKRSLVSGKSVQRKASCKEHSCKSPRGAKGFCSRHLDFWQRHHVTLEQRAEYRAQAWERIQREVPPDRKYYGQAPELTVRREPTTGKPVLAPTRARKRLASRIEQKGRT